MEYIQLSLYIWGHLQAVDHIFLLFFWVFSFYLLTSTIHRNYICSIVFTHKYQVDIGFLSVSLYSKKILVELILFLFTLVMSYSIIFGYLLGSTKNLLIYSQRTAWIMVFLVASMFYVSIYTLLKVTFSSIRVCADVFLYRVSIYLPIFRLDLFMVNRQEPSSALILFIV